MFRNRYQIFICLYFIAFTFGGKSYAAELTILESYRSLTRALEASADIVVYGRFETHQNERAFLDELAQPPSQVELLFTIKDIYYGAPESHDTVSVIVDNENIEYRDWAVSRGTTREYKEAADRNMAANLAERYLYYLNTYEAGQLPELLFNEIRTSYSGASRRIRGDNQGVRGSLRASTGSRRPPLISFDKDYVLYLEKDSSQSGGNDSAGEYRLLLGDNGVFTDLDLHPIKWVYDSSSSLPDE